MKLRRSLPILPILIVTISGLACADITAPGRSEAYEWRVITQTGPGSADTLSFHWPRSRLPVRVWAEESLNLPAHVANGLAIWKAAFLYGEFDAITVSDSNQADVIVRATTPTSLGSSARFERSRAPECEGGTIFDLPAGSTEIQPPIRVMVNPLFDPATPGVNECLALTTTHELGHAIGIFAHSPEPTDLMYFDPTVAELSVRDRATAERAYHVEPTLTVAAP